MTDLILNGGFETGNANGWSNVQSENSAIFSGWGYNSNYAFGIGNYTLFSKLFEQNITTVSGNTYSLSYYLHNPAYRNFKFTAYINNSEVLGSSIDSDNAFDWTLYNFNFVADSALTNISFFAKIAYSHPSFCYIDNISVVEIDVISNICFPAGTPITTNQGNIPIEKINPDIHTVRNKKIVGITKTITQDKYLVCFEKDALGNNIPSQKTVISKDHCILNNGKMTKAKDFINKFENVYRVEYTKEVLYNVLMEEPDKMMVNNLICETLHPENGVAKLYKVLQKLNPEEQVTLIKEYNKYAIENNTFSSKKDDLDDLPRHKIARSAK